jgi:hypothetical protein
MAVSRGWVLWCCALLAARLPAIGSAGSPPCPPTSPTHFAHPTSVFAGSPGNEAAMEERGRGRHEGQLSRLHEGRINRAVQISGRHKRTASAQTCSTPRASPSPYPRLVLCSSVLSLCSPCAKPFAGGAWGLLTPHGLASGQATCSSRKCGQPAEGRLAPAGSPPQTSIPSTPKRPDRQPTGTRHGEMYPGGWGLTVVAVVGAASGRCRSSQTGSAPAHPLGRPPEIDDSQTPNLPVSPTLRHLKLCPPPRQPAVSCRTPILSQNLSPAPLRQHPRFEAGPRRFTFLQHISNRPSPFPSLCASSPFFAWQVL